MVVRIGYVNSYMRKLASLFLIILFNLPSYAIDLKFYEGDEYWEKINSLNWTYGPATIKHLTQGTIKISEGQQAVTGDDAKQVMYWWNGEQFNIDVLVADPETGDYTDYKYLNEGYVKLDDWKDVDPDKFIKELRSGLKESNKRRIANGFNTITQIKWLREPILNKAKNTVSYATIVSFSDNSNSINASLILLGRYGYTESTYVTYEETFRKTGNSELNKIIANYDFVPEKEYSKFTTGDKVAAAGIGGLLAASLGIKAFKAGGIAALLLILKKAWFIIFIPFIFAWGWIKRLFSRNS